MNYFRRLLPLVLILPHAFAQSSEVSISTPPPPAFFGPILRPFHLEKRVVAPARLTNSPRLNSLIRSGNLYLSVRDVIALVLENNLDIAIQRYGPFMARENLRRASGGQFLRSDVDSPVIQGPTSVSTTGVNLAGSGFAAGAGVASTASFVVGYGPTPPNFDPTISAQVVMGHSTTPETNLFGVGTTALTDDYRNYFVSFNQQFVTATSVTLDYQSSHNSFNSPDNLLNPYVSGDIDFVINQNLLQGFSRAVNNRNIRVAKNNMKVTDLNVKLQVITTISAVLNLYWDLVSFNEDLRIKQQAVATAQQLLNDNQNRAKLGTLPPIEVTRAAAEVSARKEDLLIAQTNLAQQETVLKNALSRSGVESAALDEVHIIPLDQIEVPKTEELKPADELIKEAIANRPEVQQTRINLESSKINVQGTRNSLLPSLSAFAELTNNALTGALNPIYNQCCGSADPYFLGGYSNLLAQAFKRDFPNYSAGFSFSIPLRNRGAQADYATDQLQIRQKELQVQRSLNQIRVEVKNAVIGLEQARARYETAVATRQLAEQSLKAEQNRFQFGVSDVSLVIQAQKDLANDQSLEVQAMANYTHAKVQFDYAIGQTLDVNHISMEEASEGHVARESMLPASVLQGKQ